MRIFLTGGSGTLGKRLVMDRLRRGNEVLALTRSRSRFMDRLGGAADSQPGKLEVIEGDPTVPGDWQLKVDGCDAVVHLAGAGVLDKRWTQAYQKTIRDSRVDSTYQVVRAIKQASQRPRVLLNASAVGFYGNRDDRQLDETDERGEGFLADVCAEWEAEAMKAQAACRVVCMRLGMVLDHEGGAMPRILRIFRWGLGGRLGHGRQYVSWITSQDVIAMIEHFFRKADIRGPVNVVSPDPVTNRIFTRELARILRRPALFPAPAFALKLALGGASKVVLDSQRVIPKVVQSTSFEWMSPTINRGLRATVRESSSDPDKPLCGMVVIDIDSLSPGSPLLRRVLRKIDEFGARVVMATSMGPEGAREFLTQSVVDCPVISADGAVIIQRDDKAVLHSSTISPDIQMKVLSSLSGGGSGLEVTLEDLTGKRIVSRQLTDIQPIKDCIRMRLSGPVEALDAILGTIGPELWQPGHVQVHRDRPGRVDILSGMAERSVAVQWLTRRWGLDRQQVQSILTDVRSSGLAQWSGHAIALKNASEQVAAYCDKKLELSGVDGVADAVDSIL